MSDEEGRLVLARQYLDVAMGHGYPVVVDYAMLRYKSAVEACIEAHPEKKEEIEDEVILVADLACRAKAEWSLRENKKEMSRWAKKKWQMTPLNDRPLMPEGLSMMMYRENNKKKEA